MNYKPDNEYIYIYKIRIYVYIYIYICFFPRWSFFAPVSRGYLLPVIGCHHGARGRQKDTRSSDTLQRGRGEREETLWRGGERIIERNFLPLCFGAVSHLDRFLFLSFLSPLPLDRPQTSSSPHRGFEVKG